MSGLTGVPATSSQAGAHSGATHGASLGSDLLLAGIGTGSRRANQFARHNVGTATNPDWRYRARYAFNASDTGYIVAGDDSAEMDETFVLTLTRATSGDEAGDPNITVLSPFIVTILDEGTTGETRATTTSPGSV